MRLDVTRPLIALYNHQHYQPGTDIQVSQAIETSLCRHGSEQAVSGTDLFLFISGTENSVQTALDAATRAIEAVDGVPG